MTPWLQVRPIANRILQEARDSDGKEETSIIVMLELVIMHVLVLAFDQVSYDDVIDEMAATIKKHIPMIRQDAIDAGLLDDRRH